MEGCSESGEVRTEDWPGLLSFMGLSQNCYGRLSTGGAYILYQYENKLKNIITHLDDLELMNFMKKEREM